MSLKDAGDATEKENFVCTWTIENAHPGDRRLNSIEYSPDFIVGILKGTKWRLALCVYENELVDAYLNFRDYELMDITINFEISASARGKQFVCKKFENIKFSTYQNAHGCFFFKCESDNYRYNTSFTVQCKMSRPNDITAGDISTDNKLNSLIDIEQSFLSNFKDITSNIDLDIAGGIEKINDKIFPINNSCNLRSIIGIERSVIPWELEQFSRIVVNQKRVIRVASANKDTCAALVVYLGAGGFIQVDVAVSKDISEVEYSALYCSVTVQGASSRKFHQKKINFGTKSRALSFAEVISRDEVLSNESHYLSGDTLTLCFELVFTKNVVSHVLYDVSSSNTCPRKEKRSDLSLDMENLFISGKHGDITLNVGGESIPAHKAIVCAKSPVLEAMFSSSMIEKESNTVNIDDADAETTRRMLLYMYSGFLADMDTSECIRLYSLSDRYEFLKLMRECGKWLALNLSVQNAGHILIAAYNHSDDELKQAAIDYICDHAAEILNSDTWKEEVLKIAALASQVLLQMCHRIV